MKQKKQILDYTVFFQEESEGGYTAIVPTLPGCVSYGETIEEAKVMIKEAIELYLESLSAHGVDSKLWIPAFAGMTM